MSFFQNEEHDDYHYTNRDAADQHVASSDTFLHRDPESPHSVEHVTPIFVGESEPVTMDPAVLAIIDRRKRAEEVAARVDRLHREVETMSKRVSEVLAGGSADSVLGQLPSTEATSISPHTPESPAHESPAIAAVPTSAHEHAVTEHSESDAHAATHQAVSAAEHTSEPTASLTAAPTEQPLSE